MPVDGKGGARERPGSGGFRLVAATVENVRGRDEHFHIGQKMMAEGHRLGGLQMGEPRHDRFRLPLRVIDQHGLQAPRASSRLSMASRPSSRSVAT